MTAGRRRSTTRGGDSAVHIDDRLAPRWFTARVRALVIVRRRLQRRNAFWRDATQTLLIAANCRHLRDNAGYSPAEDWNGLDWRRTLRYAATAK